MSTQIGSLVYVCTSSLEELNAGVAALEDADPGTIDARLRQLESTATTLSSALDSLSKHMDELPPDDPNSVTKGPLKPVDDDGLLLRAALQLGGILDAHGPFDVG
jgi:hypothetical protein